MGEWFHPRLSLSPDLEDELHPGEDEIILSDKDESDAIDIFGAKSLLTALHIVNATEYQTTST